MSINQAVSLKKYVEDVRLFLDQYDGRQEALFEQIPHCPHLQGGLLLMHAHLAQNDAKQAGVVFTKAAVEDLIALVRTQLRSLEGRSSFSPKVQDKIHCLREALYSASSFTQIYQSLCRGEELCLD